MPEIYDNLGVRFLYPDNWTVSDEEPDQWPQVVSLQSTGSGFWSLQIHPARDPLELASEVLREMRREYEELDAEQVDEQIGEAHLVGYDMDFYCLDLVVTSKARTFQVGDQTFLLITQAEDREFQELEQVFRAITTSLLQSLKMV